MAILISNSKASFNYETLEKIEAGLELLGTEVKALRGRHGSLAGAYISIRGGEAYLLGANIPPYQANNAPKGYDAFRPRKLLLNRVELRTLTGREAEKGLTIVPISLYNKGPKIKLEIAVVRGKKKYDKRENIKKRETDREIRRTLKGK